MGLLGSALFLMVLTAAAPAAGQQNSNAAPPQAARTFPAGVKDLLVARPFTLAVPYRYDWSRERPLISSGTLVVLEVDPALVVARNAAQPILYAGDIPVQRLNHGHPSGRVVGIVPGGVSIGAVPFWFGSPELPERVTAASARSERSRAAGGAIRLFSPARVRAAARPRVQAADLAALLRTQAADLVLQYSPQERELAETWRLPTARARDRRRR